MESPRLVLLDGHVHFHECFGPSAFLAAAWANFEQAAAAAGYADGFAAYLLLTETAAAHWFDELLARQAEGAEVAPGWRALATPHPCQLRLEGPRGAVLNVVSGYQIVTAEKLEVLALGCRERVADGAPAADVIRVVKAAGAIPVVPWGFGKWIGRRARCVEALVQGAGPSDLFLGDNGNRLAGFPEPRIFRRARVVGIRVLPGTDPLPFPSEARRTGAVGFALPWDRTPEDAHSWAAIRRELEQRAAVAPYGRLETPWSFAKNQVAMQLYKRFRSAA